MREKIVVHRQGSVLWVDGRTVPETGQNWELSSGTVRMIRVRTESGEHAPMAALQAKGEPEERILIREGWTSLVPGAYPERAYTERPQDRAAAIPSGRS